MKIRDLILSLLIIGMVISTATLVAFATSGISDIKNTTSEASSWELQVNASKNLEYVAISIRDSLDSQMQIQYEMVKSWAQEPALLDVTRKAQNYTKEQLYEMWSAAATRKYNDINAAVGDGNPDNDLSPVVSKYLADLSATTNYPEISITDSRGYIIAASSATDDFDQGPDDWVVFLENGVPTFNTYKPIEGGEDWYRAANSAKDGFHISKIIWDESSAKWGIDIVSQMKDPVTKEYLGQIKAFFDYSTFIGQFANAAAFDVYEIKVVDFDGNIMATSLEDKSKVNNAASNIYGQEAFWEAVAAWHGNLSKAYLDENGESVCIGFAKSIDYNRHLIMVTKKAADVMAPIDKFIGTLQDSIGEKSSVLQRNMIIIGAAVAIVIILLAAFIMRAKVAIPLNKLTTVSDKLAKGEIEGLEIDLKGKDEISRFGESFRGVLAAFNFLKDELEKKQ